jgi:large subunit ribosomal protein L18e
LEISNLISRPKRKEIKINLEIIESETKEGDTVVVPGAVLGKGDITKKIRVCALKFSKTALEKLKKSKSETVTILEEVKKNPEAKGIKLLK